MRIVPLGDATDRRAAALFAAAHAHRMAELGARMAQRWLAVDGDVVGYAALWCMHDKHYRIDVIVDERRRGAGIGGRLLDHVIDVARGAGANSVQTRPLASDTATIAFATRRDFVETLRVHHMELVLANARHDAFRDVMDRLAGHAIAIVTFADFAARRKDAERAYIDVVESARDGWADPDAEREPTVIDRAAIVAEQRGRLVGFSSALGTGVRPEARGLGVATALKVAAIDVALARGERRITTSCADPAMHHINEKLGFVDTLCELRMRRLL